MKTVEFYYDLVSPYSYLAHGEVSRSCREHGTELVLRPMLPCHRTAFGMLEDWVEDGRKPPTSRSVPKPEGGDVVNTCRIGG